MQACADFHIHTRYSRDSLLAPKTLVKIAEKRRIDVLAVTDHDTLIGGLETAKEAKRIPSEVLIIPGMEIRTNHGHLIGLFLQERICGRDYFDVVDRIKRQDGIAIIPHPCKKSQKFNELLKPSTNSDKASDKAFFCRSYCSSAL